MKFKLGSMIVILLSAQNIFAADSYLGSYKGYGSKSGAESYSCTLEISKQENDSDIKLSIDDNGRKTEFVLPKIEFERASEKSMNSNGEIENFTDTQPTAHRSGATLNFMVWYKDVKSSTYSATKGSLNFVTITEQDGDGYSANNESFVCGQLVKK
jgi:hypothetical protein